MRTTVASKHMYQNASCVIKNVSDLYEHGSAAADDWLGCGKPTSILRRINRFAAIPCFLGPQCRRRTRPSCASLGAALRTGYPRHGHRRLHYQHHRRWHFHHHRGTGAGAAGAFACSYKLHYGRRGMPPSPARASRGQRSASAGRRCWHCWRCNRCWRRCRCWQC